jgi:hypothetical protein
MNVSRRLRVAILCGMIGLFVAMGSCGGGKATNGTSTGSGGAAAAAGTAAGGAPAGTGGSSISLTGGGASQDTLTIAPANPAIVVTTGMPLPTIPFAAMFGTSKVAAAWSVDAGEIGTIDPTTGVFKATGNAGGVVTVTAAVNKTTATTQVSVSIKTTQNGAGPNDNPMMTVGTVGDGVGGPVDMATQTVLTGAPKADPALAMLYPYDQTVWPRGLLAPLLQWVPPGAGNPTALYVHLKSSYFEYQGFFSTPPKLAAGGAFVRHPIPQQAWQVATESVDSVSGKDALVLTLVVASGGTAYGPLTETWKVAPGSLAGTVYYNSYGTALATQLTGALPDGHAFGGAVLGIKSTSLGPALVAGSTGGAADCHVCHVGSQDGKKLLVATGAGYASAVSVDLTQPTYPETPTGDNLVFSGLYPDGSIAMRTGAPSWDGAMPGYAAAGPSVLLTVPAGTAVATTGFSSLVTQAATPAFAHDGSMMAFNFLNGPGSPPTLPAGNGSQLVLMSFASATGTFSDPQVLYTAPAGSGRTPGWPAFLPTDKGILFDNETVAANASTFTNVHAGTVFLGTSLGARSELWWVDLASGKSYPLNQLNGKSANGSTLYLPMGPNNHGLDQSGGGPPGDDSTLSYEASTSPVVAGGYIWVIFTSRRMFGNVATVNPWWSDPRDHDISVSPTPKKLWVAAFDLNATPGTDPSHPAFYLPAQELLAGNSRGFWVLDPCEANGAGCQTGDQCCSGFCEPSGPMQALTCGNNTSSCSGLQEKCTTASDCCDPTAQCVNGFCAQSMAQ